jgi:hypothetical protein
LVENLALFGYKASPENKPDFSAAKGSARKSHRIPVTIRPMSDEGTDPPVPPVNKGDKLSWFNRSPMPNWKLNPA